MNRGEIALLPCCMWTDIQRNHGEGSDYKQRAAERHKQLIDISDEVLVLNVGGYIGESTLSEIHYAQASDKPVRYLHPVMWMCPVCQHVMTEDQSKGYKGCPSGLHLAKHTPVHARLVLMQDGVSFSHLSYE